MNYLRRRIGQNLRLPSQSLLGRLTLRRMVRVNEHLERCAVNLLDIQPSELVLEVGFGPGLGLKYAADKRALVYGVDVSEASHNRATDLVYQEIIDKKVELFQCSVENLPFNTSTIDKAFHCNSFFFWPDIPAGCREIYRTLKPNGMLLTVQNIDRVLKLKTAELKNANTDFLAYMQTLERVGFIDVKIDYLHDSVTNQPYQCIQAIAYKPDER